MKPISGGRGVEAAETLSSTDPSDPSRIVGRFHKGTAEDAEKAVRAAAEAFETWRWTPAEAIDFLECHAREALRLDGPHPLTKYPSIRLAASALEGACADPPRRALARERSASSRPEDVPVDEQGPIDAIHGSGVLFCGR
jgi:hypothetical protein